MDLTHELALEVRQKGCDICFNTMREMDMDLTQLVTAYRNQASQIDKMEKKVKLVDIKYDQQTRYMMKLREEAADFEERLKRLNEHHTIARYKDRDIEQEMADYEIKLQQQTTELMLKVEEIERLEYKYMKKKGEIKANEKFTFPFVMKHEDMTLKENDGLPKEIIDFAKEEVINAMQYYTNLKDVSNAIVSALRKEMALGKA